MSVNGQITLVNSCFLLFFLSFFCESRVVFFFAFRMDDSGQDKEKKEKEMKGLIVNTSIEGFIWLQSVVLS